MRRREFLTALGGLALSWPVEAYGQKPRIPRIGYLFSFTEREGQQLWDACREGLQELGYIAGQNIMLEPRWAEGRPDNPINTIFLNDTQDAAKRLGIKLQQMEARQLSDIDAAFSQAATENLEALIVFDDPVLWGFRSQIVAQAGHAQNTSGLWLQGIRG